MKILQWLLYFLYLFGMFKVTFVFLIRVLKFVWFSFIFKRGVHLKSQINVWWNLENIRKGWPTFVNLGYAYLTLDNSRMRFSVHYYMEQVNLRDRGWVKGLLKQVEINHWCFYRKKIGKFKKSQLKRVSFHSEILYSL